MSYSYRVHGINIASEIELPELKGRVHPSNQPDLRIRLCSLPAFAEAKPTSHPGVWFVDPGMLFTADGVARFLTRDGSEILIEVHPEADLALVRTVLLGPMMWIVCSQRGLIALHASSVAFQNRVVAFAGSEGAGKSTLAAHCLADGGVLMSDDFLVTVTNDGRAVAQPGMPNVKLWRDALTMLGRNSEGLRPDWFRADKFHLPVAYAETPLPLARLYILKPDETVDGAVIRRLTGAPALNAILFNTTGIGYLSRERCVSHFQQCTELANTIEILELRQNRSAGNIASTAARVMADLGLSDTGGSTRRQDASYDIHEATAAQAETAR